jgi:hypothetical protein
MGPLGAQPIRLKPNLAGAYPGTWLNLLESCTWRCGTCVHACSKLVAQVGGFSFTVHVYTYIILIGLSTYLYNFIIPQVKINHVISCNDCTFILVFGECANSSFLTGKLGEQTRQAEFRLALTDVDQKGTDTRTGFYRR